MTEQQQQQSETPVVMVVPDLRFLCTRSIALRLFHSNIRWRRLVDVTRSLKDWLHETRLPVQLSSAIHAGLGDTFREVQRWGEKHCDLFPDRDAKLPKFRVHRGEHLRLYYHCFVWHHSRIAIDDYQTAVRIIDLECGDWPQMQFQFACAYAMVDRLVGDRSQFDRIRLRAFRQRLAGHPLYDFWLTILDDSVAWQRMFASDGLAPRQLLSLVFQFAIVNGYIELVRFIWSRVTETQREYIGVLQWKKVCFRAKHREMMQFLCAELCQLNPGALARITWNSFYGALYETLQTDGAVADRLDNLRKLEFLLAGCCPQLRSALLQAEHYRALTDAFLGNHTEAFRLFLDHLSNDELRGAREYVDRVYDRRPTDEVRQFRQLIVRRQMTVE